MAKNIDAHGGNIYKEARASGINVNELLDYSANINPLGVPDSLKQAIASQIEEIVNYPDPDCSELKQSISQYLGVEKESIVIGNGASEIIFLLMTVLKPKRILVAAPTFSEYARAADTCGIQVAYFKRREEAGYRLDIDRLLKELEMEPEIGAVWICNPNNPTSTLESRGDLLRLTEFASARGIHVIIDEAFIELTEDANDNSLVRETAQYRNLFIIRAFTKLFAVPGLRLGYGLGDKGIVKKMWEKKLPWSVNTFACNLGVVLSDTDYLNKTVQWIEEEKDRFYHILCQFPQIKAFKPDTNFVLVKLVDDRFNASGLKKELLKKGILVRDASNFVFLDDRFVRLAVKDRESNNRLIKALKEVLMGEEI